MGLVQHHFGTKNGLRAACDESVLELIRVKTEAVDHGTISDPQVLANMMAMGPAVQRYVGRALVDGSDAIAEMVDQLMDKGEEFLAVQRDGAAAHRTGDVRRMGGDRRHGGFRHVVTAARRRRGVPGRW